MPNKTDPTSIFDRRLLRQRRAKAFKNFSQHDFIYKRVAANLLERLRDIVRTFPTAVIYGSRLDPAFFLEVIEITKSQTIINADLTEDFFSQNDVTNSLLSDEEIIPFGKNTVDIFLNILNFHSINDIPGTLAQINYCLKPDGLFIASLFGEETLFELRQSMMQAELELYQGISPRVFPFTSKQQLGGLLQRTHFALPVVDSDKITVTYPNLYALLHDIKGMGESNIILERSKRPVSRKFFTLTEQNYLKNYCDKNGRIEATFEIIYLTGWAPHSSQQTPLKPGSAELNLIDILDNTQK